MAHGFQASWKSSVSEIVDGALFGGHAHFGRVLNHASNRASLFLLDGEESCYRTGLDSPRVDVGDRFSIRSGELIPNARFRGNIVVFDRSARKIYVAADRIGTFPLYYFLDSRGLLFSSLLKPMAASLDLIPDSVGIVEFLLCNYTLAGRTAFEGVRRLSPGEVLTVSLDDFTSHTVQTSDYWAEIGASDIDDGIVDRTWDALINAIERGFSPVGRNALMMSGGWDSRVLLAAMVEVLGRSNVVAYTHGDVRSREISLVRKLCASVGVECFENSIDNDVFSLNFLECLFDQTENVLDPAWYFAAARLKSEGVHTVTAGVFGEVLGGHYGPAFALGGWAKIASVASSLWNDRPLADVKKLAGTTEALALLDSETVPTKRPWYIAKEYWNSHSELSSSIRRDLEHDMSILVARGVEGLDPLIEGFIAEHRGSQCINNQLLTCRTLMDVVLPYADHDLLGLASSIPLPRKIQNKLDRGLLAAKAPELLRFPFAATLVRADRPLLIQEASRFLRRAVQGGMWKLYSKTRGIVPAPRLDWINFEFMRDSNILPLIVSELQSDIWDRNALTRSVATVRSGNDWVPLHPLCDQLLKALTVDLLIR